MKTSWPPEAQLWMTRLLDQNSTFVGLTQSQFSVIVLADKPPFSSAWLDQLTLIVNWADPANLPFCIHVSTHTFILSLHTTKRAVYDHTLQVAGIYQKHRLLIGCRGEWVWIQKERIGGFIVELRDDRKRSGITKLSALIKHAPSHSTSTTTFSK